VRVTPGRELYAKYFRCGGAIYCGSVGLAPTQTILIEYFGLVEKRMKWLAKNDFM